MMDSSPEDVYDRLTSLACSSLQCPISLLTFVSDDRQFFKSFYGLTGEVAANRGTSIKESICKYVVAKGTRLVICDAHKNQLTRRTVSAWTKPFGAYAGFPIFSLDKQFLGAFCVIDNQPRFWTTAELARLKIP
jgi:GAF domain-containing protein